MVRLKIVESSLFRSSPGISPEPMKIPILTENHLCPSRHKRVLRRDKIVDNAAKSRESSFGRELNAWVQTIAIIVAASWGIYTFVYKEITLPKSAPVNVSMDLQLKKIGTSVDKREQEVPFVAVEMKVRATNPTSRSIYLLPSTWGGSWEQGYF
jgi:hypothetical protein